MTVRACSLLALACILTAACAPPRGSMTAVAAAARKGDIVALRALARAGHDLNAADPGLNHWTPLLHAIHKGQRDSIRVLIAAGADVNRATTDGLSPLEMAAGNAQADIVRTLLAAGADPREPGVFTAAVAGGAMTDIERPLLGRCNTDVVQALLERAPDLHVPDNGRGHLSLLFARLNHCDATLKLVRVR